jgi:hypothetical protein
VAALIQQVDWSSVKQGHAARDAEPRDSLPFRYFAGGRDVPMET